MDAARASNCEIILPTDVVLAMEIKANAEHRVTSISGVTDVEMIIDIGPRSAAKRAYQLQSFKTLVWNGPFGAFDCRLRRGHEYDRPRRAELTEAGSLLTVAGGGDTVAALNQAGVGSKFSYVSTAAAPSSNGWKARNCGCRSIKMNKTA